MTNDKKVLEELKSIRRKLDMLIADMEGGNNSSSALKDEDDLKQIVTNYMLELGIRADLKGYSYIRTAVMWTVVDNTLTDAMTKVLYPKLAKEYSARSGNIERGIRHAIEVGCDRGNLNFYEEIFGYTISSSKEKPTNSEFISRLADHIRLHHHY